jgi:CheY-like chemotaxis protein
MVTTPLAETLEGPIRRALLDLGLHACSAMPAGGSLTYAAVVVRDQRGREWLEAAVGDTGPGLEDERLARLDEPFSTPADEPRLELAVAAACARAHGGSLRFASVPGQGTVARLRLPLSPSAPQRGAGAGGGGRLLVIDDDGEVRRTIAGMLEFFGYEVVEAASACEAIRCFGERRHEFDLVLLDLVMPDMAGRDCFRALKLIDPHLRCLLISGQPSDEAIGDCLAGGALALVRKPFAMTALVKAVEHAIATRAPA